MTELVVPVERLAHAADLPLPAYASAGASGLDLLAAVGETLLLEPGAHALVPAGIRLALPAGCEAQIRPRSGLAARHGVTVLNSPGTIDGDYRGEVAVILINHGREPFAVSRGQRIAQLVVGLVSRVRWSEQRLDSLATDRGDRGFGSTGR